MSSIFGFEGEESDDGIIELIKANPHNYVLKPQREGGGNNYYDNDILEILVKGPIKERYWIRNLRAERTTS